MNSIEAWQAAFIRDWHATLRRRAVVHCASCPSPAVHGSRWCQPCFMLIAGRFFEPTVGPGPFGRA